MGRGDMTLPFSRLSQEVTRTTARGGPPSQWGHQKAYGHLCLPPITASGEAGFLMGCRVEHLGTACDLRVVLGWEGNLKWGREGIKAV